MKIRTQITVLFLALAAGTWLGLADGNAEELQIPTDQLKEINDCIRKNVPSGVQLVNVESVGPKITVALLLKDAGGGPSGIKFVGTRSPKTIQWDVAEKSDMVEKLRQSIMTTLNHCIGPDHWQGGKTEPDQQASQVASPVAGQVASPVQNKPDIVKTHSSKSRLIFLAVIITAALAAFFFWHRLRKRGDK